MTLFLVLRPRMPLTRKQEEGRKKKKPGPTPVKLGSRAAKKGRRARRRRRKRLREKMKRARERLEEGHVSGEERVAKIAWKAKTFTAAPLHRIRLLFTTIDTRSLFSLLKACGKLGELPTYESKFLKVLKGRG